MDDVIFSFSKYSEESKAYEKAGLSREEFQLQTDDVSQEVKRIQEKRDFRRESYFCIAKHLTSQRGMLFYDYLLSDPSISISKGFIIDVVKIFKKLFT